MRKVYLISATNDNNTIYKIGYTKRNVDDRIKEMKIGNPSHFEILETYESKWATRIEATLHNLFEYKKIDGEWFELNEKDVKDFATICEKIDINLNMIEENNSFYHDKNKFY